VYTVVFPSEADLAARRISVLAPVGTALIGYRAGDVIEWATPGGTRRLQIEAVLFQPEADDRQPEADDRQPEADDRQPEADDRQPEADDGREVELDAAHQEPGPRQALASVL
jgi:regulator of nucleoside diphosphate kinase